MKISKFKIDVSPRLGDPLSPFETFEKFEDAQYLRGLVFEEGAKRWVLAAIDFCIIRGKAHEELCRSIAKGAKCRPGDVALHVVHQHDAVAIFFESEPYLQEQGLMRIPRDWWKAINQKVTHEIAKATRKTWSITEVGFGGARLEDCASNRRILNDQGKLRAMRWSLCKDKSLRDEPVGLIDPMMDSVVFKSKQGPVASLHFYASHPQTAWGRRTISADAPGNALMRMEAEYPSVLPIYFPGCGADITFGKFTTSNKEQNIKRFGEKLFKGMQLSYHQALMNTEKSTRVVFKRYREEMPIRNFNERVAKRDLKRKDITPNAVSRAANVLAYSKMDKKKMLMNIHSFKINEQQMVFLPSEVFVEYQLYAKSLKPDRFIACAAYGNCIFGYIGVERTLSEGGYESEASAGILELKKVEPVLKGVLEKVIL